MLQSAGFLKSRNYWASDQEGNERVIREGSLLTEMGQENKLENWQFYSRKQTRGERVIVAQWACHLVECLIHFFLQ